MEPEERFCFWTWAWMVAERLALTVALRMGEGLGERLVDYGERTINCLFLFF